MTVWPQIPSFVQEHWLTFLAGALTGGFVGNVKTGLDIWDRFAKPRIAVHRTLNGSGSGEPNYIYLTNLSARPLILNYWEIVWRHPLWKFWHWRNREHSVEDAYDRRNNTLASHKEEVLSFRDGAWFDWGASAAKGRKLIFRYYITGERRARERDIS